MIPDWLNPAVLNVSTEPTAIIVLVYRIGMALLLGLVVAGLYRWACRGQAIASTFLTTLVLLAPLIAMATQVIGDNIARAFSLVGALSVVRFRTVVKDTQDTAFVIFAVVVGMAAGANNMAVAVVGLLLIGLPAVLFWPHKRLAANLPTDAEISLRVSHDPDTREAVERLLSRNGEPPAMVSAGTAKQGTVLALVYRVRITPGASLAAIVAELAQIPGTDGIEIRRHS